MQTNRAVSDRQLLDAMAEAIFMAKVGPTGHYGMLTGPQQRYFRQLAHAALHAERQLLAAVAA